MWLPKRIKKQLFPLSLALKAIHEAEPQNNNKKKYAKRGAESKDAYNSSSTSQHFSCINETPRWHSGQRDCDNSRSSELALCPGRALPEPGGGPADTHTHGDTEGSKERAARGFPSVWREWDEQKGAHGSSEGPPLSWQQCPSVCCRAGHRKHSELLQSAFSGATRPPLRGYCSAFIHLGDVQEQILVAPILLLFSWVSTHAIPLAYTQASNLQTV